MSKYIQKVERCSFLISRSVKCVTQTTKEDNSVLPEPEIFITCNYEIDKFTVQINCNKQVIVHFKYIHLQNLSVLKFRHLIIIYVFQVHLYIKIHNK
jgi:hypothetical protein